MWSERAATTYSKTTVMKADAQFKRSTDFSTAKIYPVHLSLLVLTDKNTSADRRRGCGSEISREKKKKK